MIIIKTAWNFAETDSSFLEYLLFTKNRELVQAGFTSFRDFSMNGFEVIDVLNIIKDCTQVASRFGGGVMHNVSLHQTFDIFSVYTLSKLFN